MTATPNPSSTTTTKKKSDLGPRLLTAAIAVPILLYAILSAPHWLLDSIICAAAAIAAWEYLDITLKDKLARYGWTRWFASLLSITLYLSLYYDIATLVPSICFVVIAPLMFLLFNIKEQKEISPVYNTIVTGVLYATLPISCLTLFNLTLGETATPWILIALTVTWSSDTFAYFGGRAFGKHKLSPKISPNKTIEGAVCGLLGSITFTFALDYLFTQLANPNYHGYLFHQDWLPVSFSWIPLTAPQILLIAIPANIVGQIGDLAESLIKRAHGVKDSGFIVYGHGGILDRIDGLMFSAPWVYFCAKYLIPDM